MDPQHEQEIKNLIEESILQASKPLAQIVTDLSNRVMAYGATGSHLSIDHSDNLAVLEINPHPVVDYATARDELFKLHQGKRSISEFANDLKRINRHLNYPDIVLRDFLIMGASNRIKKALLAHPVPHGYSFVDTVRFYMEVESNILACRRYRSCKRGHGSTSHGR